MNRISSIFFGLVLGFFIISHLPEEAAGIEGASEPNGVYCEINDVKLFALSEEDCAKAGGTVTHTVTTTVEPAGNAEPEIQRTKDKEPVAP